MNLGESQGTIDSRSNKGKTWLGNDDVSAIIVLRRKRRNTNGLG